MGDVEHFLGTALTWLCHEDYHDVSVHLNRISGKSMLKNKSSQIARMSMSSYVGYLHDERIIAHVIVERISNMKYKQQKQ